ncbi:MAG: hypothetical protein MUO72_14885 [Bacteroidales bacterium]|nr:hypothetical protein [Bacteroidales bacterium]
MQSITHGSKLRILTLEKRIEELEGHKREKKEQLSHVVQMLILDYLGIGKHARSNIKRAEIYAPIIGRDLETTRQYISELYYWKNIKNLSIILKYFEKAGFSDQVELVKSDIDRIKKKK